jgi:hypothetical protein
MELTKIEIIETQQESELDDEILFTLLLTEKLRLGLRPHCYSNLEENSTVCLVKRKGYGRLRLAFIEKTA